MDGNSPDIKSIMESVTTPPISQFESLSPNNIKVNDVVDDPISVNLSEVNPNNILPSKENLTKDETVDQVIKSLGVKAQELVNKSDNEENKAIYARIVDSANSILRNEELKRQDEELKLEQQNTKADQLISQIENLLQQDNKDVTIGLTLLLININLSDIKANTTSSELMSKIDSAIEKAASFYNTQYNNLQTSEIHTQKISDLTPGTYNVTIERDEAGADEETPPQKVKRKYQAEVVVLTQDDDEIVSGMNDPFSKYIFRVGDKVVRLSGDYTYTIDSIEFMDESLTSKNFEPVQKETAQN